MKEATVEYLPRDQFQPFHRQRWAIIVAHRRAGTTVATINNLIFRKPMGLRQVFLVRDDLRQCVSDWCFVLPRQTGSEELVEQRDWARSGGLSMPGPAT